MEISLQGEGGSGFHSACCSCKREVWGIMGAQRRATAPLGEGRDERGCLLLSDEVGLGAKIDEGE